MKFLVLPTWLLVRSIEPFLPKEHPWKGIKFTLEDWYLGATPEIEMMSLILWFSSITYLCLSIAIFLQ